MLKAVSRALQFSSIRFRLCISIRSVSVMNGILLKLGQKEGFLAGELIPFCRIAFDVAGGAFFNGALKSRLQTGNHAPRRFLLLFFGFFLRGGFGRPASGVKTSPEAHLHAAVRGD
ncbi:hypothetical protein, partial [Desulfovibrio sp. ZJ369]|uniref:hypothetical protein n=1 Tax=Desulfovibrio sp. ZJ369 TaxID=2709793 RepID=UPI00197DC9B2